MFEEVTVDTNVFLHANNPAVREFEDAAIFLEQLQEVASVALAVDPGFDPDPSANASAICHEYWEQIPEQSMPYHVLVRIFASERVVERSRSTPQAVKKLVNQTISNRRDRTFVSVAYNNKDKLLVSHDRQDFGAAKRRLFKKQAGIKIRDAAECISAGSG